MSLAALLDRLRRGGAMPQHRLFTDQVIADIPRWVVEGVGTEAIAERIGCTQATLKTRCSELKISLHPAKYKKNGAAHPNFRINLSRRAMDKLSQRAAARSSTAEKLAAILLETITNEDLFDAVLDGA
jgi:hypothetical protein